MRTGATAHRPRKKDPRPVGRRGGGNPRPGPVLLNEEFVGEGRPPPTGGLVFLFLYTLRPQIRSNFVKKCQCPNLSSQRAFFCMGRRHKKPVRGPLVCEDRIQDPAWEGTWVSCVPSSWDGRPGWGDGSDLVVAVPSSSAPRPPHGPPTAAPGVGEAPAAGAGRQHG